LAPGSSTSAHATRAPAAANDDDGRLLLERERRVDHRDLQSPAPRAGATVYASRPDWTIALPSALISTYDISGTQTVSG